jgi:hypothetical protein
MASKSTKKSAAKKTTAGEPAKATKKADGDPPVQAYIAAMPGWIP